MQTIFFSFLITGFTIARAMAGDAPVVVYKTVLPDGRAVIVQKSSEYVEIENSMALIRLETKLDSGRELPAEFDLNDVQARAMVVEGITFPFKQQVDNYTATLIEKNGKESLVWNKGMAVSEPSPGMFDYGKKIAIHSIVQKGSKVAILFADAHVKVDVVESDGKGGYMTTFSRSLFIQSHMSNLVMGKIAWLDELYVVTNTARGESDATELWRITQDEAELIFDHKKYKK